MAWPSSIQNAIDTQYTSRLTTAQSDKTLGSIMKKFGIKFGFICVALFGLAAQPAMADWLGLANGRSANLDNMADMSVEAGANFGSDVTIFGARVNYKLSPDIMVFGDVGMVDIESFGGDSDGLGYGFGAFYQMRNTTLLENTDFALKAAYHLAGTDRSSGVGSIDQDFSEITIEALISGDQLATTEFGWYANAGMHILKTEFDSVRLIGNVSDSNNQIGVGGGITGNIALGEWFAGIDFIDGMIFVGGFRYNLN